MYFKVVFVVINRRGIAANKKDERGEDRTRDLRFRRPTQYPLCHTSLLYSWEVFFPCGTIFRQLPILNSEIRVQKNILKQLCETLNV